MKEYSRRIITYYKGYYFDIDADRFICRTCKLACLNEDEVILHLEEHKKVKAIK